MRYVQATANPTKFDLVLRKLTELGLIRMKINASCKIILTITFNVIFINKKIIS